MGILRGHSANWRSIWRDPLVRVLAKTLRQGQFLHSMKPAGATGSLGLLDLQKKEEERNGEPWHPLALPEEGQRATPSKAAGSFLQLMLSGFKKTQQGKGIDLHCLSEIQAALK